MGKRLDKKSDKKNGKKSDQKILHKNRTKKSDK